jgi:predicted metal-binding membrane protein
MMTAASIPLMAAMMLPGALPATVRATRASGRPLTAPLFAGSYLVVWALVGLALYVLYEPPAPAVAAALIGAAVVYELTPTARACRRRCRAERRSGVRFGAWCMGSSIGLMAVLVAIDPMSLPLMCAVGAVALIQKELLTR